MGCYFIVYQYAFKERAILSDEQQGERAKYGEQVLRQLSARLMERYGEDWTFDTLKRCRQFYQAYANASISATPLLQLENHIETADSKAHVFIIPPLLTL